jgi:type I restriction enzyme S subunit
MSTATQKAKPKTDRIAADTDLPEGWEIVMLGEASDARLGKTPRRTDYRDEGTHRIIKFRDLTVAGIDYSVSKAGYVVQSPIALNGLRPVFLGDVLITASAHSGDQIGKKCAFVDRLPDVTGNTYFVGELLGITSNHHVMRDKWPFYWFSSDTGKEAIQEAVAGVHLTAGRAQRMPIPIAPPDEQDRIIKLLDHLFLQVNAARNRLGKVPLILKRFRQAILAAACSGRLSEDWRERHLHLEPANQLIEQIRMRRQAETQNSKKKVHESSPLDEPDLPDLPIAWAWTPLGELIADGPQNGLYKPQDEYGQGVPIVRIDDFQDNFTPRRGQLRMLRVTRDEARLYGLTSDDLLINRVNSPSHIGKCLVVPPTLCPAVFESNMMRMTLAKGVEPRWVAAHLRSADGRARLTENAKWAVNQVSINQTDVRSTPVALPPLEEQREIVRRVEALFKLADTIEKRVEVATKRAEKLTQAILAKAFGGELVPTEAELARREGRDYEPASALLARIRAKRVMAQGSALSSDGARRHRKALQRRLG